MGTNSIGCTEWERDYDPKTEQPKQETTMTEQIYRCRNGHQLDYANQICNICMEHIDERRTSYKNIKDVPTDLLAHNVISSLILCKDLNQYKEVVSMLIRELRGEPQPKEIQEALDRID